MQGVEVAEGGATPEEVVNAVGEKVVGGSPDADIIDLGIAVSPFIPPPYGSIATGVFAALGWLRAAQNKKRARAIVESVDHLVEAADENAKSIIKEKQGKGAKRIVDEVKAKTRISLPI